MAHGIALSSRPYASSLISNGERFRSGKRISSAMTESTDDAVVSRRFAKRQQRRQSRRGAQLSLRTRIRSRTSGGTLGPVSERLYPGLANDTLARAGQAAAG